MTRVLVVDDDGSQAEEFSVLLRNAGFEVKLAGNGREAMDLLRHGVPDIVLTDLNMPEMDGLELVQSIRREFPTVPVILMTALGSELVAAKAMYHGAASYIRKRNLAREVVQTVGSVLAVARALPQQERMLDCLTDDQLSFVLDNDADLVPPLLGYLQQVAAVLHPCDRTERIRVGIALSEALLNAIQHGNLELSSDLRQEEEEVFRNLGEERRRQSPYRDRRVRVRASLSRTEAVYVVEDEGAGFDPATVPDPRDPANIERIGGRGLMLIRMFMDEVEHNETGNRITLRKTYGTPKCPAPAETNDASPVRDVFAVPV
jgi:CheY-like chemotaxis protein/anti-sigma regulatory factor (Ser/Thr protein kinase)